jgi:hypothetical protein
MASIADPQQGLKVIHVALYRMGTMSLSQAYRILGYKVFHGLDDAFKNPYNALEEAAEATWPFVPGARPRARYTCQDWDNLWGNEFDIVTDMACPFTDQLIEAYPDAKVVIVQRSFESWWPSMQSQVLSVFSPWNWFVVSAGSLLLGVRAASCMEKLHCGMFNVTSSADIDANGRKMYNEYYAKIRAMVPADRRLEYKLGDGWEPLCAFLGKDVPDVPFPRANDRNTAQAASDERLRRIITDVLQAYGPWFLAVATGGLAVRYYAWT